MKARVVLVACAAILVAACGSVPEPRPLSEQEAELLAVVRFTNYSDRVVAFRGQVPSSAGTLVLDGRLDHARSLGYAALRTTGQAGYGSTGVLQWNRAALAFLAGHDSAADPPPDGTWQLRRMQGGELDTALALLLGLGNDRPDNAQLLRQSDARWLRSDTVDSIPVGVFEGPRGPGRPGSEAPRLRYWVDSDARLRRVEARIGLAREAASFDFTPGAVPFAAMPELSK